MQAHLCGLLCNGAILLWKPCSHDALDIPQRIIVRVLRVRQRLCCGLRGLGVQGGRLAGSRRLLRLRGWLLCIATFLLQAWRHGQQRGN